MTCNSVMASRGERSADTSPDVRRADDPSSARRLWSAVHSRVAALLAAMKPPRKLLEPTRQNIICGSSGTGRALDWESVGQVLRIGEIDESIRALKDVEPHEYSTAVADLHSEAARSLIITHRSSLILGLRSAARTWACSPSADCGDALSHFAVEFARAVGCTVRVDSASAIRGSAICARGKWTIWVSSEGHLSGSQSFSVLHEVAHILLGHARYLPDPAERREAVQGDSFASEIGSPNDEDMANLVAAVIAMIALRRRVSSSLDSEPARRKRVAWFVSKLATRSAERDWRCIRSHRAQPTMRVANGVVSVSDGAHVVNRRLT